MGIIFQNLWYQFFKIYIGIVLFFFYKKIKIYGTENIPKKGAVLFVSNHKNALLDPLIIGSFLPRNIHFLTRASVFKNKYIGRFLASLNMLPIYRIRDVKDTVSKNEVIFNRCYDILNKGNALLIFPEGTHEIKRIVKPLKKGFARIAFGALQKYPNLELKIVPIGLNYTDATLFGESVSIYYGKAILAANYIDRDNLNASIKKIMPVIDKELKGLTTHIESENYDLVIDQLKGVDYLNPREVSKAIKNIPNPKAILKEKPSFIWKSLKAIVAINSFIPLLIYKDISLKIEEVEFVSTAKFAVGMTAFPIFYSLQSFAINYFFGFYVAIAYFLVSIFLVLLLAKSKR